MKPLDLLKNVPTPARRLFRPMLMISLVLHGVVLTLPLPPDQQKPKPPKKEETVKITKLPLDSKSSSSTSSPSSLTPTPQERQVNLSPTPQERQANSSKSATTRPVPQTNSSLNQPINQPSVTSDTSKTKREQNPVTSQDSNQESQDTNQRSQDTNQESQGSSQQSTSAQKIINFFATFPRYPGAAKSSGGVLRPEFDNATYIFHTPDNLETVASKFEKELLPTQNFARPKLSRNEANFKVYEVSNSTGSETNYLYLIFQNGKTAIYLEAENYTLAQLIKGETEERNNQLIGGYILTGIQMIEKPYNLQDFKPENDFDKLDEKDKFQDKKFDLKHAKKTTANNPVSEEKLISTLEEQLKLLNFEPLSKEGYYGKSVVYKAKQGTSETFLVLAPAKDEQGRAITVIILSTDKPT